MIRALSFLFISTSFSAWSDELALPDATKRCANLGYGFAEVQLAQTYEAKAMYWDAINWYVRASDSGNAFASWKLGMLALEDEGLLSDRERAYSFFVQTERSNDQTLLLYQRSANSHMNSPRELQEKAKAGLSERQILDAERRVSLVEGNYNSNQIVSHDGVCEKYQEDYYEQLTEKTTVKYDDAGRFVDLEKKYLLPLQWELLYVGMSESDVQSILDAPTAIDTGNLMTYWYYGDDLAVYAVFKNDESKKLVRWTSPDLSSLSANRAESSAIDREEDVDVLGNWARIRSGMSAKQIKKRLGEPLRTESKRLFEFWYYGGDPRVSLVVFERSSLRNGGLKVYRWVPPS